MLRLLERAREQQVGVPGAAQHRLHQHDPARARAVVPRRRGDRAPDPRLHPLERRGHGLRRPTARASRSAATSRPTSRRRRLYEVGFNHFFRGKDHAGGGDQIYIQGHGSPGIYARAFLEGRLDRGRSSTRFRQEVQHGVGKGLPSYPHPRLMPDFWEFPTVSMGLTALNSIYQARFNRYLQNRGIKDTSQQHVWAFLGDGEMGEPESLGAIGVAAREELDNLTFVINCNLQQLDGPVRGNGKIIQELESTFRGAGWNVIKVVWGREWDDLLARDVDGVLVNQMNSTPDGAVPDLLGRGRRLHPRALLRRRPAAAQDGRAHERRADREAAARWPRLPQGVRRVRRRDQARRPADRDPGARPSRAGRSTPSRARTPPTR